MLHTAMKGKMYVSILQPENVQYSTSVYVRPDPDTSDSEVRGDRGITRGNQIKI